MTALNKYQREAIQEALRLILAWANDPDLDSTFREYYHIVNLQADPAAAERLVVGLLMVAGMNFMRIAEEEQRPFQTIIEEQLFSINGMELE